VDLTTAIDSLATAATSDCDVMAQLTLTNKQLVQTNHHLTEQLSKKALAELAQHTKQQTTKPKPNAPTKPTTSNTGTRPPFDHAAWVLSLDPTGYCWSHGYRVVCGHNSRECKGKLDGHQDDTTRTNTMGGSDKGKSWPIGEAPNSDYSKLKSRSQTLCHTPSQHTNRTPTAIADTGASGHYIRPQDPHNSIGNTQATITVGLPNGNTLQSSTNNCTLSFPQLPIEARQAHLIPGLTHSSLVSIGVLCDSGCEATFDDKQVIITKDGHTLFQGRQDTCTGLWGFPMTNLEQPPTYQHEPNNQCASVLQLQTGIRRMIRYLHATAFSPVKTTWLLLIPDRD
jgi:hypothetical protein